MISATPQRPPLETSPLLEIAHLIETRVLEPDINPVAAWAVPDALAEMVTRRADGLASWARAAGLDAAMRSVHRQHPSADTPEIGHVTVEHHRLPTRHDMSVQGAAQWHRSHSPLRLNEAMRLDVCECAERLVLVARVNHLIADANDAEAVFTAAAAFLCGGPSTWKYDFSAPVCDTPEFAYPMPPDALLVELDLKLLTANRPAPTRVHRVKTLTRTLTVEHARFDALLATCVRLMTPACGQHQVWRYPYVHPRHRDRRGYFSQVRLIGLNTQMSTAQITRRRSRLEVAGWFTETPDHAVVRDLVSRGHPRLVLTDTSFYRGLSPVLEDVCTFSESSVDDVRFQLDRRRENIELRLQYNRAFVADDEASGIVADFDAVAHAMSAAQPPAPTSRE